ncbi:MAG TPA: AI-2E family transporter [Pyrinomonadaceae bacterium]|nr:AI-2E family transporter [Pyrinomonadaceae bacterium]
MSKERNIDRAGASNRTAYEIYGPPTRVVLRVIVVVLAVAVVLWMIVKLTGVILLLVLSIFFAYLVSPLVEFIRRPVAIRGRTFALPRVAAICLAYVVMAAGIVLALYLIVPSLGTQFPEFAGQAKGYWVTLGERTQQLNEYFRSHRMPGPLVDAVNNAVPGLIEKVSQTVSDFVTHAIGYLGYLPWLILIPILAFFLLKDAEAFRRSALQMLPRGRWRWRGDEFFQDVNSTLAAYIRAQLTACLFIGIICAIGFTLLGLPGPVVMGFIAGLFEFVPLVGPLSLAILAALLATLHAGPLSAFFILLFLGVMRVVQDYFIYPRLIGQGIHLHPLAVIFAILAGHELAGVAGIFLAIPVVAILTVSYRHWMEHRGSEGLADLLEPSTPKTIPAKSLGELGPNTTADEMSRARPDLNTGELQMPLED